MASKSSWRLKFIDIDTSFSISTEQGTIKGYMVVRAPKGDVEPYYFEKGNQAAIEAYIGLGGSDYPDIEEAIAFNREYGIYISAPAGTSSEYPSYIGGKYITTEGLVDFYNVTSKDTIDFAKMAKADEIGTADETPAEVAFVPNPIASTSTKMEDTGSTDAYAVVVSKISPTVWAKLTQIAIEYQGDAGHGIAPGTYYYQISQKDEVIYCLDKDFKPIKKQAGKWFKTLSGTYTIVLGGGNWLLGDGLTQLRTASVEKCIGTIEEDFPDGSRTFNYKGEPYTFAYEADEHNNAKLDISKVPEDEGGIDLYHIIGIRGQALEGTAQMYKEGTEPDNAVDIQYSIGKTSTSITLEILGELDGFPADTYVFNAVETLPGDVTNRDNICRNLSAIETHASEGPISVNTINDKQIPFFNLQGLEPDLESEVIYLNKSSSSAGANFWSTVVSYFLTGFNYASWLSKKSANNGATFSPFVLKDDDLSFKMDIKDKTLAAIVQKSPCEKKTKITLEDIGYDQWKYNAAFPLIKVDTSDGTTGIDHITRGEFDKVIASEYFIVANKDIVTTATSDTPAKLDAYNFKATIYKKLETADQIDFPLDESIEDVTSDFITQDILVNGVYEITNGKCSDETPNPNTISKVIDPEVNERILYVVSDNEVGVEVNKDDEMTANLSEYALKPNINFGTITFKVAEGVYSDIDLTAGGTFTGSMEPTAVDSYGTNIYWPNVLNENDFSFVDIIPVNTLDKFVNKSSGIYTGERIIDDILTEDYEGNLLAKRAETTISGKRYIAHLVDKNKEQDKVGGAWVKEFLPIISKGWDEAYDANYDDVYVFMEPTGREELKGTISSLLEGTHKLAIALSVKNLTKQEAEKPSTIKIMSRHKQHAQFCGKFLEYDSKTGRNYYTCPIGDIGKMCCRIFEKKMGGWAPAWYNYNGMGGQLDRAVLKAEYNFSDSATEIMDKKGLNPIVFNADDGLMVVSSKTTQDPNNETDWNFLEHVMSFVLLKREIRDKVMRPQIKKPIDDYWMQVRQDQVDAILDKRTTGPNKIWTAATCDIKSVNTDQTKAQRKFCILVRVKTTKFAEIVELTLETVAQTAKL